MPFVRQCGKTVVEPDMPVVTEWRMRIAWCITNATNTHLEYVTLIAFPQQQWLHERTSSLLLFMLSLIT